MTHPQGQPSMCRFFFHSRQDNTLSTLLWLENIIIYILLFIFVSYFHLQSINYSLDICIQHIDCRVIQVTITVLTKLKKAIVMKSNLSIIIFLSLKTNNKIGNMPPRTEQESQQDDSCIFCSQQQQSSTSDLFLMMNQALTSKHLSQSNNHLILPIDILLKLEDPTTKSQIQDMIIYKQMNYVDNGQENLKRQYRYEQFPGKIRNLSQYYKFHKDIPHIVELKIQKILSKYYDRKREFDYKCIKKLLKDQQGLSITSVEDSDSQNSETVQKKSRYSTLLNVLGDNSEDNIPLMSDSNLLQEICKQIGKALPKTKILDNDFKGSFFSNQKLFENYVKNQQLKKINKLIKTTNIHQHFKKKSKGLFSTKNQQNYFNFSRKAYQEQNQTIKNRFDRSKGKRSIIQRQKDRQKDRQDRKRFIYNTNIKIQIQNALFYPNDQVNQFGSGAKNYQVHSSGNSNVGSRKNLMNKISTLNEDKYRTPVTKIYQPQQTDISTRYRKKVNSYKKERMKTKESRDFKEMKDLVHDKQRQMFRERQRQIVIPKRVLSSHAFKKNTIESNNQPYREKIVKNGTISVAKLKLEHQKNEIREIRHRGSSIKRASSTQNIRKRSITLSQNRNTPQKVIPITKYSSSQIKDNKFKGVSIKQLLNKKLNIYDR